MNHRWVAGALVASCGWSLACAPPCPDGLTFDDGACFGDGSGVERPITHRGHPECILGEGDGRLDVRLGCVDGACDGDAYERWEVALGPGLCLGSEVVGETTFCEWRRGMITTMFADVDLDGRPDQGVPARGVWLEDPYEGSSPDGLGMRVSLDCFYQVLGEPDDEDWVRVGELEQVAGMSFDLGDGARLTVDDGWGETSGMAARMSMFGPYEERTAAE